MKYPFLLILAGLLGFQLKAQNVAPNPSFEQHQQCPSSFSQVNGFVNDWINYTSGSPDYYHQCSSGTMGVPSNAIGYQPAASGVAYMGMITYSNGQNYREYIMANIPPLQIGATYRISMSVSLANQAKYSTYAPSVYFFDNGSTTIGGTGPAPGVPQISYNSYGILTDTQNWVRLTATFLADSAYDNVVIGNFSSDNNTANNATGTGNQPYGYYLIDSFEIFKSVLDFAVSDTVHCQRDTFTIPYSVLISNYFTMGNAFTAQLSGPTGSFTSSTNIGSVTTTASGNITAVIPQSAIVGSNYRLRIISTQPADTFSVTQTLDIFPSPIPTASGNSPICVGSALNLNVTGLSAGSVNWTGPATFTSTMLNPSISNTTMANSGDYIVTATLNGCTGRDTVTVSVNPIPATPTATNNGPLCVGQTLNLTAASTTMTATYLWTGPNGFTSTQSSPSIAAATSANAGVYTVTAKDNGCNSPLATTTVVVKPTPATPVAAANTILCNGSPLYLSASSITGANYTWSGPNNFTSNQQNPTINPADPSYAGKYYVFASLNGCESAKDSVIVTVNFIPKIGGYASPNDTICQGTLTTFVAMQNNGGPTPLFQWYKNYTAIPGANSLLYPTSNLATGDAFYCTMYAVGVCTDPVTVSTDTMEMTVLPIVTTPSAKIASVPELPQPSQPTTFTVKVLNGGPNPKYQWQLNGIDMIGAIYATWSASTLRSFDKVNCLVTSNDPCANIKTASSDTIMVGFATNIADTETKGIRVYPNPTSGKLVITLPFNTYEVEATVTDMAGRIVERNIFTANEKLELDLSNRAKGTYLLIINTNDEVYRTRVILQ